MPAMRTPLIVGWLLAGLVAASGCAPLAVAGVSASTDPQQAAPTAEVAGAAVDAPPSVRASTRSAPGRLVAVGDLHGDLAATRRVLRLVGAVDEDDRWVGGDLTVVQVGDQTDRGPDERAVLDLLHRLEGEAAAAGGQLVVLHGNHELMNVAFDFRYVPANGWTDFETPDVLAEAEALEEGELGVPLETLPEGRRGRYLAFRPGGPYARRLAPHDVVAIVGDTLFVHGGVLPVHVEHGLDRLNAETRAWLLSEGPRPEVLRGPDSPVWSRHYSNDTDADDCALLEEVLDRLGLARMVVAHTVQGGGITAACSERVWRVDVGLSAHYGGPTQALEILPDGVRVLEAPD